MRGGYFIHPYGSYPSFANFPVTGSANTIFIDEATAELYIWDGISYVAAAGGGGGGPSSTDGLPEGSTNLYYLDSRVETVISTASLDDLGDVNAAAPATDDLLAWSGTRWVSKNLEDIAVKQYNLLLDEISASVSYVGEALPGTLVGDAAWRIKKLDESGDPELIITWADGTADFDKVWDDRATYTYS